MMVIKGRTTAELTKESYVELDAKAYAHRYVIEQDICESTRGRLMCELSVWFARNVDTLLLHEQLVKICRKYRKID